MTSRRWIPIWLALAAAPGLSMNACGGEPELDAPGSRERSGSEQQEAGPPSSRLGEAVPSRPAEPVPGVVESESGTRVVPGSPTGGEASPPVPGAEETFPPTPTAPKVDTREELVRSFRRIKRLSKLPRTAKAGCREVVAARGGSRRLWGPPAPRVAARRVGRRVVVNFEFTALPRSPACRPYFVDLVALSHDRANRSHQSPQRVLIRGRRGSATVELSRYGPYPAYYLRVRALSVAQAPGPETRIRLP